MDGTTGAFDPNYGLLSYLRFRLTQFADGEMTGEAISSIVTMVRRRGVPDMEIVQAFAERSIEWDPVTNVVRKP